MNIPDLPAISRRSFLWKLVAVPVGFVIAACSGRSLSEMIEEVTASQASGSASASLSSAALAPTPACGDDDDDVTIAQTEGRCAPRCLKKDSPAHRCC